MASIRDKSSPMAARRLRSSRMLRPASTRIRVFSVASRAAFPELPLASTQNLTILSRPLRHSRIQQNHIKQNRDEMFERPDHSPRRRGGAELSAEKKILKQFSFRVLRAF